jgi:hypothetical protein
MIISFTLRERGKRRKQGKKGKKNGRHTKSNDNIGILLKKF